MWDIAGNITCVNGYKKSSQISSEPEPMHSVRVVEVESPTDVELGTSTSIRYSCIALGSSSIPHWVFPE